MFSRSYEKIKQENSALWENTAGNYFVKTMALLRAYCWYDPYPITEYTLYAMNTHRDEIYEIITLYEKRGYLKTHQNTLVCNIAFLLLLISRKIPREKINPEGGFVALIHVIEENTGLRMNGFYQENLALQAYFLDENNHQAFLECKSWSEFILRNVKNFLPYIENKNDRYRHPINPKSLKKQGQSLRYLIDTCSKQISADASEINRLLYCDKKERHLFNYQNMTNLFNSAIVQLPYEYLAYFIEQALIMKAYYVVWYLFCTAEKLTKSDRYFESRFNRDPHSQFSFEELMNETLNVINKPIANTLLLKLIAHGKTSMLYEHAIVDNYIKLYSKKEFIDFEKAEDAFILCYQPNMYWVFLKAVDSNNLSIIKHLIQFNKIDLKNNTLISFQYASDGEWNYDSIYAFSCGKKGGITITPLQALLLHKSFIHGGHLSFVKDVIEIMIQHDVVCASRRDNIDRSVAYYFQKLKKNIPYDDEEKIKLIQTISNLLNQAYWSKFIFMAFQTLTDFFKTQVFPTEIIPLILIQLKAFTTLHQNETPEELFSINLQHGNYKEALSNFCNSKNIELPKITVDNLLIEFCHRLEKPVKSSFMLILFDHVAERHKNKKKEERWGYKKPEFHMEYLALCRRKCLISNWRQVETQFQTYFHPNIECVFNIVIKDKLYFGVLSLLNELMQNILENNEYHYYKFLLSSQIRALIKQDPQLRLCDYVSDQFFAHFNKIKAVETLWNDNKQDLHEMSQYVNKLQAKYYFPKLGLFFYAREPKLSEKVMIEIVEKTMSLET